MERTYADAQDPGSDWREVLMIAFGLGHPGLFDLERLIDTVEQDNRGTWRSKWS